MGLDLNLRFDLARLSDAELAQRFEENWRRYEAARQRTKWWDPVLWFFRGWRGPIRHPRAYRMWSAFLGTNDLSAGLLGAVLINHDKLDKAIRENNAEHDGYLILCEIQDLADEAERRMAKRKATS